jgi:hypothetical protein
MKKLLSTIGLGLILISASAVTFADEKSADDIAKELANPASSLSSLNLHLQYTEFAGYLPGAHDEASTALVFQPTLPFPVGDKGNNIIFRPVIPLVFDQPKFDSVENGFDSVNANLADIGFDLALAGTTMTSKTNGYLWGYGMAGTLPTATDNDLTGDQWRVGPEIFGGIIRSWGLAGALVSNQWNVGGSNDESYSVTTAQYFYAVTLGNGWQIASSPILTYDWEADSGQALTLPLGFGVAKTSKIKKTIVKYTFQIQKYVAQADAFGPDWLVKFTITPVISNPFVR